MSPSVGNGESARTKRMLGDEANSEIGVKALKVSYGIFGYRSGLVAWPLATTISVYPSGADVASACEATTPPAPGRFSTTTDWPHILETTSPSVRARISTPPPAEYGTK